MVLGAVAAAGLVGLVIYAWVTGRVGLPYAHTGTVASTNLSTIQDVVDRIIGQRGDFTSATADVWRLTAENYLWSFAPALLAIGPLLAFTPRRLPPTVWLLVPLAAHGAVVWALRGGRLSFENDCPCIDGSPARYFLPLYAAFALAAALFLQGALDRLPHPRMRQTVAVVLVALIVIPGLAQAYDGDRGVAWAVEQRRWEYGYELASRDLPPRAVVAGNFLSKVIQSRPVLVPDHTSDFPGAVDRVLSLGRPVYVDPFWLRPGVDEIGDYGQALMRSGHHYLVFSGVKQFYEIRGTNATVRGVFDLASGAWNATAENAALRAEADPAYFRIVDRPDGAIPLEGMTVATATITVTYLDDAPRVLRAGYRNFDSNSTVELAAWAGSGSGAWVTHTFVLQPGLVVTGAMYLTGTPTVRELAVTWS